MHLKFHVDNPLHVNAICTHDTLANLRQKIANVEKKLPKSFISKDGFNVNAKAYMLS